MADDESTANSPHLPAWQQLPQRPGLVLLLSRSIVWAAACEDGTAALGGACPQLLAVLQDNALGSLVYKQGSGENGVLDREALLGFNQGRN